MKRTSVMLPADLKSRGMRTARQQGISFGELLRRSLQAAVDSPASSYDDPVYADAEVFDGPAPDDLASAHDRYLYGSDG